MKNRRVLWIDDDGFAQETRAGDFSIVTAANCKAAFSLLEDGGYDPDLVIVDAVLPQRGWPDSRFIREPGIAFVEYVRRKYGTKVPCAVYSIAVSSERRDAALRAGAQIVRGKTELGLLGVIQELDRYRPGTAVETKSDVSMPGEARDS
jgi:CheY-like chemotaxis protein